MEKLYFEIPGVAREKDAVDYIREFHEYQSDINGTGGLDRFTDNYEGWLEKLEQDYTRIPILKRLPIWPKEMNPEILLAYGEP